MPGQAIGALQQMAQPRVEARSLSQLNYLAANPPKYPVNPTEARQPPLTLYISRVPGSRDVILSTFKPQLKNVTGEDIANSFYLIHLDLPSDELHLAGPQDSRHSSPTSGPACAVTPAHSPIARKPLPASAKIAAPVPVPPAFEAPAAAPASGPAPALLSGAHSPSASDSLHPEQAALGRTDPGSRSPKTVAFGPDSAYPNRYGDVSADRPVLSPRPNSHNAVPTQRSQGSVSRKPLGPRPIDDSAPPVVPPKDARRPRPKSVGNYDGFLSPKPASGADPSMSPPSPLPSPKPALDSQYRIPSPPSSPSPAKRELVPFTLTIIRRDPVSGNQWNVGKVSSFQQPAGLSGSEDVPGTPTGPDAGPTYTELAGVAPSIVPATQSNGTPPAVNIRLETSGYAKYRGMFPTRESQDTTRNRTRASSAASSLFRGAQGGCGVNSSADSLSLEYFTRNLLMGYTKTWATNIRDHLRSKSRSEGIAADDDGSPTNNPQPPLSPLEPPPRPPFYTSRPGSAGSVGSGASVTSPHGSPTRGMSGLQALQKNLGSQADLGPGQATSPNSNGVVTTPGPGLRPRGYVFISPWDGLCEFRTSSSGRGVKCTHSLGGDNGASSSGASPPSAPVVSELRFNLPSADLFRDKGLEIHGKLDKLRLDAQRSLAHHTRGSRSVDAGPPRHHYDDFPDPFDTEMGLGRERAGGGNRGKRAKLGKLIIHDEGLKMLDLVVAANMGVWWGAWERSF